MAIRNNKFARQNENIAKRNIAKDEKMNVDAQLARLEEDIRRLKIEYDIFFNGAAKRAPYDTKNRVETTFKRLGDERSLTFAQRYYYNSLVARYTAFKELWRRTMQGREEGREAATHARLTQKQSNETENVADKKINESLVFSCSDAERETATVRKIYNALLETKKRCGESSDNLAFERFAAQLAAQTERFKKSANCERVSFEIGVDETGKVSFKARAAK
jgi:hypothetical protein